MSRLGGRAVMGRMRVRFKRAWRGYKAGDEIAPPAALREQLLRTKTPLGDPVAELVDAPADAGEVVAKNEAAPGGDAMNEAAEPGLLDAIQPKGKSGKGGKGGKG